MYLPNEQAHRLPYRTEKVCGLWELNPPYRSIKRDNAPWYDPTRPTLFCPSLPRVAAVGTGYKHICARRLSIISPTGGTGRYRTFILRFFRPPLRPLKLLSHKRENVSIVLQTLSLWRISETGAMLSSRLYLTHWWGWGESNSRYCD